MGRRFRVSRGARDAGTIEVTVPVRSDMEGQYMVLMAGTTALCKRPIRKGRAIFEVVLPWQSYLHHGLYICLPSLSAAARPVRHYEVRTKISRPKPDACLSGASFAIPAVEALGVPREKLGLLFDDEALTTLQCLEHLARVAKVPDVFNELIRMELRSLRHPETSFQMHMCRLEKG